MNYNMNMLPFSTPNSSLVLSFLDLRKAIGVIGLALPFVLALGKIILEGGGLQSSISSYYYTIMRDVFVGSLVAIGVFMTSYRGYERIDAVAGKLAAAFAIGAALFPTFPPTQANATQTLIAVLHGIFAALLFLSLAFFSLALFRKTNPSKTPTPQKRKRNFVYTVCGIGIVICVVFAVFLNLLPKDSFIFRLNPIFWLEAFAIVFFGISWFVKGEAILKDEV
ncbi:MAG: hypothetical protein G01um101430_692 [Parcubacteria group bacterium Gr01-1014_30]|nr:MAG: hypothetical protein G01um101430_692 [Parcubacteria group bacterium Gr01-1014_30]